MDKFKPGQKVLYKGSIWYYVREISSISADIKNMYGQVVNVPFYDIEPYKEEKPVRVEEIQVGDKVWYQHVLHEVVARDNALVFQIKDVQGRVFSAHIAELRPFHEGKPSELMIKEFNNSREKEVWLETSKENIQVLSTNYSPVTGTFIVVYRVEPYPEDMEIMEFSNRVAAENFIEDSENFIHVLDIKKAHTTKYLVLYTVVNPNPLMTKRFDNVNDCTAWFQHNGQFHMVNTYNLGSYVFARYKKAEGGASCSI